jgi:hypothetical protein
MGDLSTTDRLMNEGSWVGMMSCASFASNNSLMARCGFFASLARKTSFGVMLGGLLFPQLLSREVGLLLA